MSVLAIKRTMQILQLLWVAKGKFKANMDSTRILNEGNIPEIRILPEAGERSKRRPSNASMAIALRLKRIKFF